MKQFVLVLAVCALVLSGCAGNGQPQAPGANVPPAPGNNATPNVPPGAASPPSPPSGEQPPVPPAVPPAPGNSATPPTPSGQGNSAITLAVLATHNTAADCWMAINGSVYDLSNFSSHPGGMAYVPYCGTDATSAYDTKGGTGKPHSANAHAMLPQYYVGAYAG